MIFKAAAHLSFRRWRTQKPNEALHSFPDRRFQMWPLARFQLLDVIRSQQQRECEKSPKAQAHDV